MYSRLYIYIYIRVVNIYSEVMEKTDESLTTSFMILFTTLIENG
uniref:Uncharacterized protein n=1 Tax=Arundo donax TaxID=35708 RepID=A0A0A8YW85_ARUDO